MIVLEAGANCPVQGGTVRLRVRWGPERIGGAEVDVSAFLLGAGGRVIGDEAFLFYNQLVLPGGSARLSLEAGRAELAVETGGLPGSVEKVVVCVALSGARAAGGLSGASLLEVECEGTARFVPKPGAERGMILAELYRRSGQWKLRAVGQGYLGGLGPMAREYGVDISDDPDQAGAAPAAPVAAPAAAPVGPPAVPAAAPVGPPAVPVSAPPSLARSGPPPLPPLPRSGPPPLPAGAPPLPAGAPAGGKPKLSLEKKLDALGVTSPKLLTLAKTAQLSLKKRNLDGHAASVGLCMDVSGSMGNMFRDGTVQTVIERVLGLGLNFDDNGAIDVFAFAATSQYIGELRHDRFPGAAAWIQREEKCGGTTSYAPAIWKILEHYGYAKDGKPLTEVKLPAQRPVYLLFITDGGNDDKNPSKAAIEAAARFPVFFQFVGIGGAEFPFLERLDDLKGRFLDNVDFFEMNNPAQVPEAELYDKVMAEYPKWLAQAQAKNIVL